LLRPLVIIEVSAAAVAAASAAATAANAHTIAIIITRAVAPTVLVKLIPVMTVCVVLIVLAISSTVMLTLITVLLLLLLVGRVFRDATHTVIMVTVANMHIVFVVTFVLLVLRLLVHRGRAAGFAFISSKNAVGGRSSSSRDIMNRRRGFTRLLAIQISHQEKFTKTQKTHVHEPEIRRHACINFKKSHLPTKYDCLLARASGPLAFRLIFFAVPTKRTCKYLVHCNDTSIQHT
jgi:hypothetical protein